MFTPDQITTAHSKVKSGADFPGYIQEIKQLGVIHYEAFVSDGHTIYYGSENHQVATPVKYPAMEIAAQANDQQFKAILLAHQKGQTDYHTFCVQAANSGIERWTVRMKEMTCTYYDKSGNAILTEDIPG